MSVHEWNVLTKTGERVPVPSVAEVRDDGETVEMLNDAGELVFMAPMSALAYIARAEPKHGTTKNVVVTAEQAVSRAVREFKFRSAM